MEILKFFCCGQNLLQVGKTGKLFMLVYVFARVYVCTRTKAHSHPLFIRYQPTWLRLTDLKWHQTNFKNSPLVPNTEK